MWYWVVIPLLKKRKEKKERKKAGSAGPSLYVLSATWEAEVGRSQVIQGLSMLQSEFKARLSNFMSSK